MNIENVPVLFLVDVEPWERQPDRINPADWHGVEQVAECLNYFRTKLRQQTGNAARFTWNFRMDPQIAELYGTPTWAAQRFARMISELSANGDELGLHTHAWRWVEERKQWVEHLNDQSWVNYSLQVSFAAYREAFGMDCRSFRFGAKWFSTATAAELERLGARFDLTVEPASSWQLTEPHIGELPDFESAPVLPYRPAHNDFLKVDETGQRNLWMIPLTTVSPDLILESRPNYTVKRKGRLGRNMNRLAKAIAPSLAIMYEGYLDWATAETIYGWVYNPGNPEQICEVDIYDGDQLLSRVLANGFRADLLEAGIGDGYRSFWLPAPSQLRDGRQHLIHAKIAGYDFELGDSPKTVFCDKDEKAEQRRLMPYLNCHPSYFRQTIDSLLSEEMPKYLAFVIRSDAGADKEAVVYLRQNLEFLLSYPTLDRLKFVTPSEMEKYFPEMMPVK